MARFGNESVMISNSSCRYITHEYVFDYNILLLTIAQSCLPISISLFNDLSQNPNKKNIVYIWNWLNVAGVYPIYIGMNVYKFNSWKHSSRHTFIRLSYVCVYVCVCPLKHPALASRWRCGWLLELWGTHVARALLPCLLCSTYF